MNYVVFNNTYTYGTGNYADVYLRNAGRWASQVGSANYQLITCSGSPGKCSNRLMCFGGTTKGRTRIANHGQDGSRWLDGTWIALCQF